MRVVGKRLSALLLSLLVLFPIVPIDGDIRVHFHEVSACLQNNKSRVCGAPIIVEDDVC